MNVVGYVRLSRDEDKANYSSIISQQDIINEYAKERNWTIWRMYIDDNCSGYSLDRPAFSEMINEIEKGNIDTILTKDLSRIGRNNGKVLVFIDRLKELNRRLILIAEGNSGMDLLNDENDILGIKTWYNEMYIKDISRKIRANMNAKQKKGELIMGNFYGYRKVRINNKFNLIADENIKPIIELIFKEYINGCGYKKICDILNEKNCPTPSQYISKCHEEKGRTFNNSVAGKWQAYMVKRIIQNDIYIGTLRTRKEQSRLIKGRQEKVDREHQYVFPNNHEPMIDEYKFRLAQEINEKRRKRAYRSNKDKYDYIFKGFMECGDCGYNVSGLNLRKAPAISRGYNCTMYMKYGKKSCTNHSVKEEKVLFFFKEFLKDVRKEYEEYISSIRREEKKNNIMISLNKYKKSIKAANEELKLILKQKIKDITKECNDSYREIIENSYTEMEEEKKRNIFELSRKISELEKNINLEKVIESNIEIFDSIINSHRPEKKYLEMILDKIIVDHDRNLEFILKVDISKLIYSEAL